MKFFVLAFLFVAVVVLLIGLSDLLDVVSDGVAQL